MYEHVYRVYRDTILAISSNEAERENFREKSVYLSLSSIDAFKKKRVYVSSLTWLVPHDKVMEDGIVELGLSGR